MFRHGDDFVVLCTRQQQQQFPKQLSKYVVVKHLVTIGPRAAREDVEEANRIVGWVKRPYGAGGERIEYEADPRHAELIIHQLGFSSSLRGDVFTPSETSKPGVDHSTTLNNTDRTLYRSAAMRFSFFCVVQTSTCNCQGMNWRWMQGTNGWWKH